METVAGTSSCCGNATTTLLLLPIRGHTNTIHVEAVYIFVVFGLDGVFDIISAEYVDLRDGPVDAFKADAAGEAQATVER